MSKSRTGKQDQRVSEPHQQGPGGGGNSREELLRREAMRREALGLIAKLNDEQIRRLFEELGL